MIGKAVDINEFDGGKFVMARRLGRSISKISRLIDCSRSSFVSIYEKLINDGETTVDAKVLNVHATSQKKEVSHRNAKLAPDNGSALSQVQVLAQVFPYT